MPFEIVTLSSFTVTTPSRVTVYNLPAPLGAPNPMVPTQRRPSGSHFPSLHRTVPATSSIEATCSLAPVSKLTRTISFCNETTTVESVSGTTVDTIRSKVQVLQVSNPGKYSYRVLPSISTQKSDLRSGCHILPSPVVAFASKATTGF